MKWQNFVNPLTNLQVLHDPEVYNEEINVIINLLTSVIILTVH